MHITENQFSTLPGSHILYPRRLEATFPGLFIIRYLLIGFKYYIRYQIIKFYLHTTFQQSCNQFIVLRIGIHVKLCT